MDILELLNQSSKEFAKNTIGTQIRMLRQWMNLTQDQFAQAICINSRITVTKMEKADSVEDINTESLYRLHFFLKKVAEQYEGSNGFIVDLVNDVYKSVDLELSSRVSNSLRKPLKRNLNSSNANYSKSKTKRDKQLAEC